MFVIHQKVQPFCCSRAFIQQKKKKFSHWQGVIGHGQGGNVNGKDVLRSALAALGLVRLGDAA